MTKCDNKEVNDYMHQMKMNGDKQHFLHFCCFKAQLSLYVLSSWYFTLS